MVTFSVREGGAILSGTITGGTATFSITATALSIPFTAFFSDRLVPIGPLLVVAAFVAETALTPRIAGLGGGGTLDDRRVALGTGNALPKVPARLGKEDLATEGGGCAGDGKTVAANRFCWVR